LQFKAQQTDLGANHSVEFNRAHFANGISFFKLATSFFRLFISLFWTRPSSISRVRGGGAQMGASAIAPAGIPIDIHNASNISPTVFFKNTSFSASPMEFL
jgi:hypothetical protein